MTGSNGSGLTEREAALTAAVRDELNARLAAVTNREGLNPREVALVTAVRDDLTGRFAAAQDRAPAPPPAVNVEAPTVNVEAPAVQVVVDTAPLAAALDRMTDVLREAMRSNAALAGALVRALKGREAATVNLPEMRPVIHLPELRPVVKLPPAPGPPAPAPAAPTERRVVFEHNAEGRPVAARIVTVPPPPPPAADPLPSLAAGFERQGD